MEPGHRESRDRTRRGGVSGGSEGRAQGQTHHCRERATGPPQGIPHERDASRRLRGPRYPADPDGDAGDASRGAPWPRDRPEGWRNQEPHRGGGPAIQVRQSANRGPGSQCAGPECADHGREACERPRAGMALPSGGPLDRAPDHGGRREGLSRGHRGQADRAAPPHGEVQGRSHQVLRGTAESLDGPRLRGREAQTRCHRRDGRDHGPAGEAAGRDRDQAALGGIHRGGGVVRAARPGPRRRGTRARPRGPDDDRPGGSRRRTRAPHRAR